MPAFATHLLEGLAQPLLETKGNPENKQENVEFGQGIAIKRNIYERGQF